MNYRLLVLLEKILGVGTPTSGTNVAFYSPFCVHYKKKLEINLKTEAGKNPWHCWVSNEKGRTIYGLFKKLKVEKQYYKELEECIDILYDNTEYVDNSVLYLPDEFVPLSSVTKQSLKNKSIHDALVYLYNRNITATDIKRYNIGYCITGEYRYRIIVPSYDENGKLNYFIGRSIYSDKYKYKGPPVSKNVVAFDMFINWDLPIYFVEGVFDAISVRFNAIPLLGKTLSTSILQKIIDKKPPSIYIALDSDAKRDSLFIAKKLMGIGINVHIIDLNAKDPNQLGSDLFFKSAVSSKQLNKEDLIKMEILL